MVPHAFELPIKPNPEPRLPRGGRRWPAASERTGPLVCRHGFYQEMGRYAYPIYCRELWADQVRRGLRSSTVYMDNRTFDANDPVHGFAMQLEAMLEVGLVSRDFPVLAVIPPPDAVRAQTYATRPWPELVIANVDDPGEDRTEEVRRYAQEAHEHGFRSGTHLSGVYLNGPIGSVLDVWLVTAYTWQFLKAARADERGKEAWATYHWDLSQNPLYARLLFGAWSWARQVPCLLAWAFTHHSKVRQLLNGTVCDYTDQDDEFTYSYGIPTPQGPPLTTPGYLAIEQGIKDCRALQWAQDTEHIGSGQFRDQLRTMFYNNFPQPPNPLPECDWDHALGLLGELRAEHETGGGMP